MNPASSPSSSSSLRPMNLMPTLPGGDSDSPLTRSYRRRKETQLCHTRRRQRQVLGANTDGRLGQGDTLQRGGGTNGMGDNLPPILLGTGRTAVNITAGQPQCARSALRLSPMHPLQHARTCALLDHGSAKCWGRNNNGQLGLGDINQRGGGANEMGDNLPPIFLGTGDTAVEIAAGLLHACALLDHGSVKC